MQAQELNDSDDGVNYDTISNQKILMDVGIEDVEKLYETFVEFHQEVPTAIKIVYNLKNKELSSEFSYEAQERNHENESGAHAPALMWFNEIKHRNEA